MNRGMLAESRKLKKKSRMSAIHIYFQKSILAIITHTRYSQAILCVSSRCSYCSSIVLFTRPSLLIDG